MADAEDQDQYQSQADNEAQINRPSTRSSKWKKKSPSGKKSVYGKKGRKTDINLASV